MQKDYKNQMNYNKNKSDPRFQPYSYKKNTIPNTPPIKTYTPSTHPSYSHSINPTPPALSSPISIPTTTTKESMPPIQINELLFSKDDTYENLVSKNIKLRTLVIQASNTISELSKKCKEIESTCNEEKEAILVELDKISQNYQLYADSHKQINKIKNDFQQLTLQYNQNNKVMEAYQQSIVSLLKDNMKTFANITNMINSRVKSIVTPQEFLFDMRQFLWENLNKYHKIIDAVVFGSFYDEYTSFISMANEEEEYNEMNHTIHKKKPNIRKKEYIDNSSSNHPPNESKTSSQSHRYNRYTQHKHNKSYDINSNNKTNNKSKENFSLD